MARSAVRPRIGRKWLWRGSITLAVGALSALLLVVSAVDAGRSRVDGWSAWPPSVGIPAGSIAILAVGAGIWMRRIGHRNCRDTPRDFLGEEGERRVVAALAAAQATTTARIRVYLAYDLREQIFEAARREFDRSGMSEDPDRNGVLIFVAVHARELAVLGDRGIDDALERPFWHKASGRIEMSLGGGSHAGGLEQGIELIAEQLARHFPRDRASE